MTTRILRKYLRIEKMAENITKHNMGLRKPLDLLLCDDTFAFKNG